jgi:Putative heavy-metal-binding
VECHAHADETISSKPVPRIPVQQAIERLGNHAAELGADGVIDTKVIERADAWGRHVIGFVAYGTAVAWNGIDVTIDPVAAMAMLNSTDLGGTGPS